LDNTHGLRTECTVYQQSTAGEITQIYKWQFSQCIQII